MAIFNGIYSWDGTKTDNRATIAWFGGSYDVKIFSRAQNNSRVAHLKPLVCVFSGTGEGQSISANPEKFAKQICHDFSLDMERVLWVEDHGTGDNRFEVLMFTRSGKMGETVFYRIARRCAGEQEIRMINNAFKQMETA